jgi:hypothetical protein
MNVLRSTVNNFRLLQLSMKNFDTLQLCLNNFRESGTIGRKEGSGQLKKFTREVIENVQQLVEDSPRTSIRRLLQRVDFSVGPCHKILKEDLHLFPYHLCSTVTCE